MRNSDEAEESNMPNIPRITVDELKRRMDAREDVALIDVRNPQAWEQSETMIPGAIRVPRDEWEQNVARIPKNQPVVTYCT